MDKNRKPRKSEFANVFSSHSKEIKEKTAEKNVCSRNTYAEMSPKGPSHSPQHNAHHSTTQQSTRLRKTEFQKQIVLFLFFLFTFYNFWHFKKKI